MTGSTALDLTGAWAFGTDPDDRGISERWYSPGHRFDATIAVPGAWNTQGVEFDRPDQLAAWLRSRAASEQPLRELGLLGPHTEADRIRHVYPGPAWYQTTIHIPADWDADRTVLVLEGVQRSARIWLDGVEVAQVVGALVPTRIDVSTAIRPGHPVTLAIRVDARRDPRTDPWWGCRDTLDFLFLSWGGLWAPVRVLGERAVRISSIGVKPDLVSESVRLEIMIDSSTGAADHLPDRAEVRLLEADGAAVARGVAEVVGSTVIMDLTIPGLRPWSPADPHRYRAEITLRRGEAVLARRTEWLGFAALTTHGTDLVLNGLPFFARGYGDDCIFPTTIAPPHDVQTYRERLRTAKEHGFTWVRLHSWVPPEAILTAADEVGMLVQPELPTGLTWEPPAASTHDLVRQRWAELITAYRHHPSVALWCMGNELYDGHPLGAELYGTARQLDSARLVIESDGTRPDGVGRDTLDLAVVQFAEGSSTGVGATETDKYVLDPAWTTPVVAHEVGYYVTLPRLEPVERFGSGLRPYWLTETAAAAARLPDRRYEELRQVSVALQRTCLKINTEAARASGLAGLSHWLLYDYPACAEGILDVFGASKGTDPAWLRTFNQPAVALVPGLDRNHRGGSTMTAQPMLSVFEQALPVECEVLLTLTVADEVVAEQRQTVTVDRTRTRLPTWKVELPTVPEVRHAVLTMATAGAVCTTNRWDLWVYPEPVASASTEVLVAEQWSDEVAERLAHGGRVVLLDPTDRLPVTRGSYRPAAWDGAGHHGMIFDRDHPALAVLNTHGWADLQLFHLVEGAMIMSLDERSADAMIIQAIDRPDRLANRSVLAEFAVGPGRLLISGLNLAGARAADDPCADTLLAALTTYAASDAFHPTIELPTRP